MAHVVAEPCFDCKYTDCVVVCPVDCFYEGAQMLYIHPEECIDCEACVPECPVEAIFHEDNLPDEWKEFTALNAEESPKCPVITEKKDAMLGESCTPEEPDRLAARRRRRATVPRPFPSPGAGDSCACVVPRGAGASAAEALGLTSSRRWRSTRRRCGSSS